MKIYLIGLPHAGKSLIGKLLAEKLSLNFIDINDEIEKEALMFLDELYETNGLNTIEKAEANILEKVMELDNVVVATGANVISNRKNKKYLNGHVIFLDVDEKNIEKRMKDLMPSYLLIDDTLENFYQRTYLLYRNFADAIVDNNYEVEKTLSELILHISKLENK